MNDQCLELLLVLAQGLEKLKDTTAPMKLEVKTLS